MLTCIKLYTSHVWIFYSLENRSIIFWSQKGNINRNFSFFSENIGSDFSARTGPQGNPLFRVHGFKSSKYTRRADDAGLASVWGEWRETRTCLLSKSHPSLVRPQDFVLPARPTSFLYCLSSPKTLTSSPFPHKPRSQYSLTSHHSVSYLEISPHFPPSSSASSPPVLRGLVCGAVST